MLQRRGLFGALAGLLAAPAVVKAESLMPIRVPKPIIILADATSLLASTLADTIEQYREAYFNARITEHPYIDYNTRGSLYFERHARERQAKLAALEARIAEQSQTLQDAMLGMSGPDVDPRMEYWMRLGGRDG
jgi:hypothetical protein